MAIGAESAGTGLRRGGVAVLAWGAALVACGGGTPVADPSPSPSAAAVCGNGVAEGAEECDDGNADNADRCLTTCLRPVTWVPSDPHVHTTGCDSYASPETLVARLRAQGLKVGAALVWGEGFDDDALFFTGRDHPLSTADLLLHFDMEVSHFAAARTGHLVLLGLDSLHFSEDVLNTPAWGVPVAQWARRQSRAVVGMAHGEYWPADGSFPVPPGGCCVPWEVVVQAARGQLDFLSTERAGERAIDEGTYRLWKALQNAGYRVAIAGASDIGCLTRVFGEDTPRTDVIVGGTLSYEAWLQAIKAGRTAAATGSQHLNLRVDGRGLGEELRLPGPQDVTVTLETAGPLPADLEVLVNGTVAARATAAAGAQVVQLRLPVSSSSWIAARSRRVLTSPVYVLVDGRAIRGSADDICYLWRSVEDLTRVVSSGQIRLGETSVEAIAVYEQAIAELQRRFVESGGTTCR